MEKKTPKKPAKKMVLKKVAAKEPSMVDVMQMMAQMIWSINEGQKAILESNSKLIEAIAPTPVVPVEPKEPVYSEEINYQIIGTFSTRDEFEMNIEVLGDFSNKEQAEQELARFRELYTNRPYEKNGAQLYFRSFTIKENVTKVITN